MADFSLSSAYGLNGPGKNLFAYGQYPTSITGWDVNGASLGVDSTTFGYNVMKCVSTTDHSQAYIFYNSVAGKTYLTSAEVYSPDSTYCRINQEGATILGRATNLVKNQWTKVWILATLNSDSTGTNRAVTFYGPAGTYYYRNVKICEAPTTALYHTAYSLYGDDSVPFINSFLALQEQCRNTGYFNSTSPRINHVRDWMNYNYSLGTYLVVSSSTSSIPTAGGTVTITYTIGDNRSNGLVKTSGVKPTVTSTVGTVSGITSTSSTGVGTATLTVSTNTNSSARTITITVAYGGVSKTVSISQAAGKVYGNWVITLTASPNPVAAAGGSSTITATAKRTWGYGASTGGGEETGTPTLSIPTAVTGASLSGSKLTWTNNTSTTERSVTVRATISGVTKNLAIKQSAGSKVYGDWVITLTASPNPVAAAGGSSVITTSASRVWTWNGVSGSGSTETGAPTLSIPTAVTGSSLSGSKLTWTNNTSTSKRSVTVRATIGGVTKDLAIEQSAGSKVYSDITIVSFSYATFAAVGETKTPSLSYSQTWTWNGVAGSGGTITSGGTVTYGMTAATGFTLNNSSTGSITASNNKNKNTRSTTASVTISNLNGKSKSTTTTVTQNAGSYWCSITAYGTPTISIGSGITAAGGSATVTATVSNTQTCYWNGVVESTTSVPGTVTLSIQSQYFSTSSSASTGTAITRYSLSGTTLSHTTMAKNVGYDYCIVKAVNAGDSSKTKTATNKVQNSVGSYYITSYGVPVVSVSSNALTAAGGSITFKASVTNNTRRDYTSGSYDTSTATGSIGEHTISTQFFTTSSTATSGSTLSRFSNSGWKVSHTSMGTNVGYDVVRYFARNAGDTSKVGYSDYIRVQNTITVTGTTPSYGSWVYNWTTTGNSTRTRSVTYTDTYASGSTANRAGTAQTETGGARYIVLDSFSDNKSEGSVHEFSAAGGSITARTVSHDYWPNTSGTHIQTVVITGVTTTCTGFTCTTSGSTVTITAASKGTTPGDANQATLTSTKSGWRTRSYGSCKQEANVRSLSSVYTVPYKPDSSWITDVTGSGSKINWSTVPVSGGYLKSRAYANYKHTSGSPLNDQIITHDATFAWSGNTNPTWITAHTNGGYYVHPNGGNANTRTSTGTYSYTYGNKTETCTESITQEKDTYKDRYEYKTELSLSSSSVTAAAGSLTATIKVYRRTVRDWSVGSDQEIAAWALIDTTPTVTDNVNWASVGTVSRSSTGTYTATVSYNANGRNTSTRTATITATANSKSATASFTQAKDTYTDKYEYKIGLSLSSSSVTAAAGSITATIEVRRRTVRDWSVGSDQEIATWALIDTTPTVTDNVNWASVGTVSRTGTGTYTATVSYNANTSTSSTRTVTVTASANSKSATASMTQAKDSIKTYGDVTVSLSYANVGPSTSNMTASPSISYSQTITYVSGSTRAGAVSITKWEVSGTDNSYGTLNTSNGKVVWKANPQVMSDRSETIKVTVTGEGSKTKSTTATSTCKADSVKTYGGVTVSLSYANVGPSTSNMTASPSISYSQTITYKSGSTRAGSVSITKWEVSGTDNSYGTLNTSNGKVVWKANPQVMSDRSETIKVTVTGEGSKTKSTTATSTCKADSVKSIEAVVMNTSTSSCHWYYSPGSSSSPIAAAGGTASPVGNGACKFTFTSGSTATQSSAGTHYGGTLSFKRTYSGSATGFTVNTTSGVVTASNNTTSTQKRSVSVTSKLTVSWNSKSDDLSQSRDCYQAAGTTYYRIKSVTATSTSLGATYNGWESIYVTMQKTVSGSTPTTSNTWSNITGTEAKNIWGTSSSPFYLNVNQAGTYDDDQFLNLSYGSITLLNGTGTYKPTVNGAAVSRPSMSAEAKWRAEFIWHNNDSQYSRKNTVLILRDPGNYGYTGEGKNYITFTQAASVEVIPIYLYGCNNNNTDIYYDFAGTVGINQPSNNVQYQSSGGCSVSYGSYGLADNQLLYQPVNVPLASGTPVQTVYVTLYGSIENTLNSGRYRGCKMWIEVWDSNGYVERSAEREISRNYDPLEYGDNEKNLTFDMYGSIYYPKEVRLCFHFEDY